MLTSRITEGENRDFRSPLWWSVCACHFELHLDPASVLVSHLSSHYTVV